LYQSMEEIDHSFTLRKRTGMRRKMRDNEGKLNKTWAVFLIAFLCCALWSSAIPSVKIGYRLFDIDTTKTSSVILFAGMRFFFSGIFIILFQSIQAKKWVRPQKSSAKYIMVLGLFQTILQYVFFYTGVANTAGVKASILVAMNTFFAILVSALIFRYETLSLKKIIGCIIGFAGVVLINTAGSSFEMSFHVLGDGAMIMSAAANAFAASFTKKYSKYENPVTLSGYQFLFGGAVLILAGLLTGGEIRQVSPGAILILIYLILISSVAYTLWMILLAHNPVSKVAIYGFMNPIMGVILSSVILSDEKKITTGILVVSLILVSAGILIVNGQFRRNKNNTGQKDLATEKK